MGLISRTTDLIYTFRFLRLLTTPWTELDAFKHGIIDKDGNVLRRSSTLKTDDEKSCYNLFHRLVFNIKRLINKVPFGKSKIASYAAALLLVREETGMSDAGLKRLFEKLDVSIDMTLNEGANWILDKNGNLQPGSYKLTNGAVHAETGEIVGREGTSVVVESVTVPFGSILGIPVYSVRHRETRQMVLVSTEDLTK
jgi:hypothetical protein